MYSFQGYIIDQKENDYATKVRTRLETKRVGLPVLWQMPFNIATKWREQNYIDHSNRTIVLHNWTWQSNATSSSTKYILFEI